MNIKNEMVKMANKALILFKYSVYTYFKYFYLKEGLFVFIGGDKDGNYFL